MLKITSSDKYGLRFNCNEVHLNGEYIGDALKFYKYTGIYEKYYDILIKGKCIVVKADLTLHKTIKNILKGYNQ